MDRKEIADKIDQIKAVRNTFAQRDAAAQPRLGSNEPLITDRLRQVFAPSVALSMTQTMRELRAAGFSGTESRVKSGLSRLVETGELVSNGRLYSRRNIPK